LAGTVPLATRLAGARLSVKAFQGMSQNSPVLLAYNRLLADFPEQAAGSTQMHLIFEARSGLRDGIRTTDAFDFACEAGRQARALAENATVIGEPSLLSVAVLPTGGKTECIPWESLLASEPEEIFAVMSGRVVPPAKLLLDGSEAQFGAFAQQFAAYQKKFRWMWSKSVSEDGRAMLMILQLRWDAVSWRGFHLVEALRESLRSLSQASHTMSAVELSGVGVWQDFTVVSIGALPRALIFASIVSWTVLALAFRSPIASTKLVITVVLPLLWVYGSAVWLFGQAGEDAEANAPGMHFTVPCATSMLLVALALDYNVFFFSRALEFRRQGLDDMEAIRRGLASTGPLITCAGAIFALEFSGLYFSEAPLMRQAGFVVVLGVLVDTFIVRSMLLPAVLSIGVTWNWPADIVPVSGQPNVQDDKVAISQGAFNF